MLKKLLLIACLSSFSLHASYRELALCVVFSALSLRGLQIAVTERLQVDYVKELGGISMFLVGLCGILGSRGIISKWDKP